MESVQLRDITGNIVGKVSATRKQKTYVSRSNPSQKEINEYDADVNKFLATIDNRTIILKDVGRYIIGETIYTTVVYYEATDSITVSKL